VTSSVKIHLSQHKEAVHKGRPQRGEFGHMRTPADRGKS